MLGLPFHSAAGGSQTSKPIWESDVGVATPITRQKGMLTLVVPTVPPSGRYSALSILVLGAMVMLFLLVAFMLAAGAVHIISRDMLVPMFALEDISIGEAWERAREMIVADKSGYAGYYGMCILLAIAVAIVFGIIGLILIVVLLIPLVVVGVVVVAALAATGWNPLAIAIAVLLGLLAVLVLVFALALIRVPAVVFRQNYGMYFFGARYRPLMPYMYPPPPPMPPPYIPPPAQPIPA